VNSSVIQVFKKNLLGDVKPRKLSIKNLKVKNNLLLDEE